jgi:hypothetical protein
MSTDYEAKKLLAVSRGCMPMYADKELNNGFPES